MATFEEFGPFTLLEKLAEGGMAFTWLARSRADEPGAEFVLKRILPRLAEDPELRALFLDEARVALRLNHPNVVRTFGFGDVEGEYWLAMEHIWGQDLRRSMERAQGVGKAMPLKLAVDIVARAARGLHAAHDLLDDNGKPVGLVHRDVSPPNLLLGFDGSVKLVDFGIARSESRFLQAREGQLKGKFSYMSPEQVQGLEIDHRSDIFSLGIILYELTTRTRLFKADSDVMTIKLVSEARFDPPNRLRADFPPRLSEIIVRALAADPRDRYDSARDLADALELFLKETRQESTPQALAAWMRDIFPDRIEELNELTGREYTGALRKPTLPALPAAPAPARAVSAPSPARAPEPELALETPARAAPPRSTSTTSRSGSHASSSTRPSSRHRPRRRWPTCRSRRSRRVRGSWSTASPSGRALHRPCRSSPAPRTRSRCTWTGTAPSTCRSPRSRPSATSPSAQH